MPRTRLIPFVVAACSLISVSPAATDELDFVPSSASSASDAGVPVDRALRPLEQALRSLHPELVYTFVRAQGVLSEPGNEQATTIQTVSLATFINLGQFLIVRYRPSWSYYSNEAFDNSFAHEAGAQFARSLVEWNLRASYRFSDITVPLVETGMQTSLELHEATFQGQRRIGARSLLELSVRQSTRRAGEFSSSETWSTQNWFHYELSESVSAAAGFVLGYASVGDGNDMSFHQLNGRIRWQPAGKLWLDANGGVETRRFLDSDLDDAHTPVYGAALTYKPLDHTTLTINGDQTVSSSYFQRQIHRTNSWQATLSQRVLGRFHVGLSYRRRGSSYSPTSATTQADRQDEGRVWRIDVSTSLYHRGALTVFFQDKRNASTDPRFAFDGHQIGFHFSLAY